MQITVIERAQNIQVQEQEIIRRERELDATIRKPAEAEKFRLEKLADANKYEIIWDSLTVGKTTVSRWCVHSW